MVAIKGVIGLTHLACFSTSALADLSRSSAQLGKRHSSPQGNGGGGGGSSGGGGGGSGGGSGGGEAGSGGGSSGSGRGSDPKQHVKNLSAQAGTKKLPQPPNFSCPPSGVDWLEIDFLGFDEKCLVRGQTYPVKWQVKQDPNYEGAQLGSDVITILIVGADGDSFPATVPASAHKNTPLCASADAAEVKVIDEVTDEYLWPKNKQRHALLAQTWSGSGQTFVNVGATAHRDVVPKKGFFLAASAEDCAEAVKG